jgi:hypothetical protein
MSISLSPRWKTRWKVASVHFACSLLVLSFASCILFFLWFPFPYWNITGGQRLIGIIFTVDLVLGPLLTFLLFDIRKSRHALALDMTVIVTLQALALSYGLHSAFVARPIYLVYEIDRFVVVTAADIDPDELPRAQVDFQQLPWRGINTITVRESQSPEERAASLELALAGKDISLRPKYWKNFDDASKLKLRKSMRELSQLSARGAREEQLVRAFLQDKKKSIAEFSYIPGVFRDQVWSIVLSNSNLDVVGHLPIDGF